MRSKRIQLILHNGTPYGVRTAELSNWSGKVVVCPRFALKEMRDLPEGEMPAVYFLLGSENQVYVGETDMLSARVGDHDANKDFWDTAIAVTSPDLTKTEVKYLECIFF